MGGVDTNANPAIPPAFSTRRCSARTMALHTVVKSRPCPLDNNYGPSAPNLILSLRRGSPRARQPAEYRMA